jgi:hypothetical protein
VYTDEALFLYDTLRGDRPGAERLDTDVFGVATGAPFVQSEASAKLDLTDGTSTLTSLQWSPIAQQHTLSISGTLRVDNGTWARTALTQVGTKSWPTVQYTGLGDARDDKIKIVGMVTAGVTIDGLWWPFWRAAESSGRSLEISVIPTTDQADTTTTQNFLLKLTDPDTASNAITCGTPTDTETVCPDNLDFCVFVAPENTPTGCVSGTDGCVTGTQGSCEVDTNLFRQLRQTFPAFATDAIPAATLTGVVDHTKKIFSLASTFDYADGDTIFVAQRPGIMGACECAGQYTVASVNFGNTLTVVQTVASTPTASNCELSRPETSTWTSSVITSATLFSTLQQTGALTVGSITVGFGHIRAASIEISSNSYLRSATTFTSTSTAWLSADCAKLTAACQPEDFYNALLTLGDDITDTVTIPSVFKSSIIFKGPRHAKAVSSLYQRPTDGLSMMPHFTDDCFAAQRDQCAAMVLNGGATSCTLDADTNAQDCSYQAATCTDSAGNMVTASAACQATGLNSYSGTLSYSGGVDDRCTVTASGAVVTPSAACLAAAVGNTFVAESCAATDLATCAAVTPTGNPFSCSVAGTTASGCTYYQGNTGACYGTEPSFSGCACHGGPSANVAIDSSGNQIELTTVSTNGPSCTSPAGDGPTSSQLACEGHFCEEDDGTADHVRTPISASAACSSQGHTASNGGVEAECVDGDGNIVMTLRAACLAMNPDDSADNADTYNVWTGRTGNQWTPASAIYVDDTLSGANAKQLFGSATAVAGSTGQAATYTGGGFNAYDFSGANQETLVVWIDGVRRNVPLTASVQTVAAAVQALSFWLKGCTVNVYDRSNDGHSIDLGGVNKIGFRSTANLQSDSKQFWLVPVFDPISEYSLGGSRELFIEDTGLPGVSSFFMWVGKHPLGAQRFPENVYTINSDHTVGWVESNSDVLSAGVTRQVTIMNPLIQPASCSNGGDASSQQACEGGGLYPFTGNVFTAASAVYVSNADDCYSHLNTLRAGDARDYGPVGPGNIGLPISGSYTSGTGGAGAIGTPSSTYYITVNPHLTTQPANARPTLFLYAKVQAGRVDVFVQNVDTFDCVPTPFGYTWKFSWVLFI